MPAIKGRHTKHGLSRLAVNTGFTGGKFNADPKERHVWGDRVWILRSPRGIFLLSWPWLFFGPYSAFSCSNPLCK